MESSLTGSSKMVRLTLLLLLVASVANALESPGGWELLWESQDDYDTVKYPQSGYPSGGFANFSYSGRVKSTGRPYTIYIATLSKGLPDTFGFELPSSGRPMSRACVQVCECV